MSSKLIPQTTPGRAFVLSGPSGSGKTTLVDKLHQEFPHCIKNVSFTTRAKREGEKEGVDYFFISNEEFEKKVEQGEFFEHIDLFGHKYGSSKVWVLEQISQGKHVILVLDTNGALTLKRSGQIKASYIFVQPPSREALMERLGKRDSESEDERETRLGRAAEEMALAKFYDYEMVNDKLEEAYQVFKCLVVAELHKVELWY